VGAGCTVCTAVAGDVGASVDECDMPRIAAPPVRTVAASIAASARVGRRFMADPPGWDMPLFYDAAGKVGASGVPGITREPERFG
jgi:hypothetical protein